MKLEILQFLHAELNHLFFNGELEPAVIQSRYNEDEYFEDLDGTEAEILPMLEPWVIRFYCNLEENSDLYLITVLLHEMVHQYCAENEIEDTDDMGHTDQFRAAAEAHGLENDGYKLTAAAEKQILQLLAILEFFARDERK